MNNSIDTELTSRVAKLSFGSLEILLPQNEIVSIENKFTLVRDQNNKKYMEKNNTRNEKIPTYCFSETMKVLEDLPDERFQCVVIQYEKRELALLCHDINKLELHVIHYAPVPLCMDNGVMPITHFCTYKDAESLTRLGLLATASSINKYISQLK